MQGQGVLTYSDNIVQNSSLYGHSIIFYDSTIRIVKITILFWGLSSITFLKWKCFTLEYFDVLQNSFPSKTVVRNSNCNFSLLTSHPLDFIIPLSISFELCYLLPHPLHLFPSLSFLCPSLSLSFVHPSLETLSSGYWFSRVPFEQLHRVLRAVGSYLQHLHLCL